MTSPPVETVPNVEIVANRADRNELTAGVSLQRSWVFRMFDLVCGLGTHIFGAMSIVVCTALAANIPIIQFISFGYLIEVCGRISRGGTVSAALVGIRKAARIGGVLAGTWLLLIPIRFLSDNLWYESFLIDPTSRQTTFLRIAQYALIGLTLIQILAAWIAGGKFRYFFWQVIAPFSFAVWCFRKTVGIRFLRIVLSFCLDWISPNLANDLGNVRPPSDWFVPAIVWKRLRSGEAYSYLRNGLWQVVSELRLHYYFRIGITGFAGTMIWLLVPTALLIGATELQPPLAVLSSVFGFATAVPIFAFLPAVQAHFSKQLTIRSFFEVGAVYRMISAAPLAYVLSLLLVLVFALPLFLAKVEPIPQELVWMLSVVFVVFAWPSRIFLGLAYRRGTRKKQPPVWWIRLPILFIALPISAAFTVIFFFTQYVSWHGAVSLFENHVYLLPAPYWL